MKSLYAITLCGALVLMRYVGKRARDQRNPLAKALTQLMLGVTVTVLASLMASIISVESAALFAQELHYASTEWLLVFLLRFMEQYTEDEWESKRGRIGRIVIYTLAGLNTCSLILNNIFHHVVTCQYVDVGGGTMFNVFTTKNPWYSFHLCFSGFLVVCALSILIRQSINAAKFYRKRYLIAMIMLVAVVITEAVCFIINTPYDLPLYGYIVLTVFFAYYSTYFIPKDLITSTLAYVVGDLSSGIVCFDMIGNCIYANDVALRLYNHPSELSELNSVFKRELGVSVLKDAEEKKWNKEIEVKGKKMYLGMNFEKIYDEQKSYMGCYFFFHDNTEDVERLEQEHYRSTHDMLTRLYNKEYFYEYVQKMHRRRPDKECYIVCTDIKDFKMINDLYGVGMGDHILIRLAYAMKHALKDKAICARLESDHFAFFLPKELFDEEKVLEAICGIPQVIADSEYQMVIHCGVYQIQKGDMDASVMCDRANIAIGTIKNDYECKVAYYDERMMEQVLHDKRMVAEFDSALESGQFVMYLQPQVACDGTVLGGEALVRWIHPERGMVPPGEFIELFEKAGIVHYLDAYIWELAARKLREWKENGHEDLHISVNISAKDFYYLDIYKCFTELVEKYDIAPQKLKLEITETAIMMDLEKQLVLLGKLQDYGFFVEIDDFGSGYSSLNMLKDICADVLKIDMGFLRETENRERTRIILQMIIDLAKKLNMIVVTEGVETKEQVEYLTEAGCDVMQGYYFSRPIAVEDFEKQYFS